MAVGSTVEELYVYETLERWMKRDLVTIVFDLKTV